MLSPSVNEYLVVPPGDVQFIEKVEAGGYGEVWKGKWKGKGGGVIVTIRKVPVIRVPARQQRAILMEVDMLTKIHHPNVLHIFGACFVEQRELWIVMEFMEGRSLYAWLHSDLEISWSVRLRLAHQAAIALNVMHLNVPSVLHKDFKSSNFTVSLDGSVVKLIGFGLSKVSSVAVQHVSLPGEGIETVRWSAPELFDYPPEWTTKTDIFSLGITFYEIASRKVPYENEKNDNQISTIVQQWRLRPDIPLDCPIGFATIIRECWRDDALQRPTSLQLLEKIEAAMDTYMQSSACSRFDSAQIVCTTPPGNASTSSGLPATTIINHPVD